MQFDGKTLDLPATLPPGTYNVAVKLYWYVDQKPLTVDAPGQPSADYYVIGPVTVS